MNFRYRENFSHILNLKVLNNLSYLHVTMPNIDLLALKKEISKIETKAY
jgi:hypothetical protein